MRRPVIILSLVFLAVSGLAGPSSAAGQVKGEPGGDGPRLARLVEANILATHAYQVLLAKKLGKGDSKCYSPGKLSDAELEALVAHQGGLLKSDPAAVRAWALGRSSAFEPSRDLEPIVASGLTIPQNAPVNVFTAYLRRHTKEAGAKLRAVASLYQTILEIDRDGDLLQKQFAFYVGLGLPVYVRQLGLAGSDGAMLAAGQELAGQTCASPFDTNAAAWQIAGRKVWNWGEKHLHVRDEKVLATELLKERDVEELVPRARALPAQRIAVVGHSFTMGQHWSSPSSFVPVVAEILRRANPGVELRQFAAGGLTATRAERRFYREVLAWKPDKVLLVVMTRADEDYDALRRLGEGFADAGIKVSTFDDIQDPESVKPGVIERAVKVAREAGIEVIEVDEILRSSPDREKFLSLDRIHMTEPYHRLMAREWLKFLVGARGAKSDRGGGPV